MNSSILLAVALCLSGCASTLSPTGAAGPASAALTWRAHGPEVFADASAQNRPVLMRVGASWCPSCRWMKRTTFRDDSVTQYIASHFIAVDVDVDKDTAIGEPIARQLGIPATVIVSPAGEVLRAIPAYRNADDYLRILKQVIEAPDAQLGSALRSK